MNKTITFFAHVSFYYQVLSFYCHSNTNLTISHSRMSHFLYINIHQFCIHFYIQYHMFQGPQSSSSLHIHQHSIWFHLRIALYTLSFNHYLHSHESCWIKSLVLIILDTKLKHFYFNIIYFNWNTYLSIWSIDCAIIPATLIKQEINKKVSSEFFFLSAGSVFLRLFMVR